MWMLLIDPGGWKITGRKELDETGMTEIYGSNLDFQRTIVPPLAFAFMRGSSGSNLSSVFAE